MNNNTVEANEDSLTMDEAVDILANDLQAISDDESLDKYELIEAFRNKVKELRVQDSAEMLLSAYSETGDTEVLRIYRKIYETIRQWWEISEIAPFFNYLPLKLFDNYEEEYFPECLKQITHIRFDGIEYERQDVMHNLACASAVTKSLAEFFNDFPRFVEIAKQEGTTITEIFNERCGNWINQKENKKENSVEPYTGFDGFEALPLDVAKKFVRKLEDLVKDLEDQDIYKRDAAPIVLALLEQGNYKLLVNHLFMCLDRTNDVKYYKLFRRIYDCIEWVDCEEEAFAPFDWEPVYNIFKGKADIHTAILKEEVTTELEFDGKTISIEEYMQLAQKVNKMNNMLLGSLLVNNETRYAVATGTGTPTEIFAKKIEMRKQVNNRSKK